MIDRGMAFAARSGGNRVCSTSGVSFAKTARARRRPVRRKPMNEEALNLSIRRFLKRVGVDSQRQIEHAVAKAAASGAIQGNETFRIKMTLEVAGLEVNSDFTGDIALE